MKKVLKQVLGIDVAQKELVVCLGRKLDNLEDELYLSKVFDNNKKGIKSLLLWVNKNSIPDLKVEFVMEATGVYHETLAYYLDENQFNVSVVMPSKISYFAKTLDIKTVTDKTSAEAICLFGLSKTLTAWHRPNPLYKALKQLTRERDQIVAERTMIKNMLHAEEVEAEPNQQSINRMQVRIKLLDKQSLAIENEILAITKKDKVVEQKVKNLCSIPGVGILTASIILAETNGFEHIKSRRQLASYAGFDVKRKESGTSIRGKTKISKQGNVFLRKAMHLPSLSASRNNQEMNVIFNRIYEKTKIKMKALVAVQRRLLELAYTINKKNTAFIKNFKQNNGIETNENNKIKIAPCI